MTYQRVQRGEVFQFTRDSEASNIENESLVYVGENQLRYRYWNGDRVGVYVERPSTNFLWDSANPSDQSILLPAGDYVFSSYGGNTVIDVGGDVNEVSVIAFTLIDETPVSVSPTSSVSRFQLEPGQSPTSFIRTSVGDSASRGVERLSHERSPAFSRNSGTFIFSFSFEDYTVGKRVFSILGDQGQDIAWLSIGPDSTMSFNTSSGQQVFDDYEDTKQQVAITYDVNGIRCYFGEETNILALPESFRPQEVTFGWTDVEENIPDEVIFHRYQYRPRALSISEVSALFGFDFDTFVEFEVSPEEINDWSDSIFSASEFGME